MKILVSDLDGTIYRNKMVSAIDLKMINDFASRNMFVIATGRSYDDFMKKKKDKKDEKIEV